VTDADGAPKRRDLLQLLAAGSATALATAGAAGGVTDPATDAVTSADAQGDAFTGRVENVANESVTPGEGIERVQATAIGVPGVAELDRHFEFIDGDGEPPENPRRDIETVAVTDGSFSVAIEDVDIATEYVLVYVRAVVSPMEGGRSVEWFDMDWFDSESFHGTTATFTLRRRRISREDAPVAVWQTVTDDGMRISAEARGTYRKSFVRDTPDETSADTELAAGLLTLQVPEDVTVGYREERGPEGSPLEPGGYYTDDLEERAAGTNRNPMGREMTYLERAIAGRDDGGALPFGAARPLFPAFESGENDYYRPYDDGSEEREEANADDLFFDVINFVLMMAGPFSPTALIGLGLTIAGIANNALKDRAVELPDDLPSWAAAGPTYRDGGLEVNHDAYDFVTGQWRWDTFGFVQPYPITFENDVPGRFCLRGLVREERERPSEKRLRRFQQAFVVDPTVRTPGDDGGLRVPDDDLQVAEPPTPDIEVSNRTPTAGDTVTLDGTGSTAFRDLEVESYEWFVRPPKQVETRYADVDDDGTADLVGPGGYEEAPRTETGETVSAELGVAGTYEVRLTVTDETGTSATRWTTVRVAEPPPPEILPTEAAVDDCYFPPTGESAPATGAGAARHFGYGCGDWKVYRVVQGEAYTVAATVDDCAGCVLHDASFVVEEPADPGNGVPIEERSWTVTRRQERPLGKVWGGETFELTVVPETELLRVRNLDAPDSAGVGFYASVYGPRPEGGGSEGTTDAGSDEPLSNE
jgi:hypothetical protein